ncbi:MAG TPA: cytochrome P450, partial [Gaiellaceae bacterium]|nr:cytochrome P450 [Gaiellaceae bacterium]
MAEPALDDGEEADDFVAADGNERPLEVGPGLASLRVDRLLGRDPVALLRDRRVEQGERPAGCSRTEEIPRPVRPVDMSVVGSRGGPMVVGEQTRGASAPARETVGDGSPLDIPYAVRWLVPKGERFANFPLLNDNDTQLDFYRRFGHIYAVGIPTKKWRIVVVSDPELLDEVAGNEEQFGKRVEEINFFAQLQNTRGGGISVIGDGEHYEQVLRVMLPWYSPQHQRTQLVRMKEQARKLVAAWSTLADDEPIDARSWMERYTLEVSGRGACSYDFGLLEGDKCPHMFAQAVPDSTKESILRVAEPRPDLACWRRKQRRY